jgi:molybdopterin adenylyltransferase
VSVAEHKHAAPAASAVRIAAITVSDTRTEATDAGGRLLRELSAAAGFVVERAVIVPDDPAAVATEVQALVSGGAVQAILLTGGTGLARRDTTVEALAGRFDKTIEGFGELFRWLSFQEIGPAAMLSRACAGVIGGVVVFLLPGSPAAVRLALERLILPELAHVVSQLGGGAAPGASPPHHHGKQPHGQH